ncbi:MAG: type VI secretion system tip protein TssI/VgrG [Pseudomonadota bacterium]
MLNTALSRLLNLPGTITQETRLLQLTTPLGSNTLLAECVRGEEGIDQGFRFILSTLSPDASITLKSLLGQPALLQLLTAASRDRPRPFHGHITGAEMSGANGGLARYQLTLEPWLVFLGYGRDSRVFQDMTVFDILDAIFSAWQGKGRLVPAWRFDIAGRDRYRARSLTTQYQESDQAFVERLMNEEGLFHYFEHVGDPDSPTLGSHTMVIADHNGSFKPNSQPHIDFSQSSAVMKKDNLDRWRTEVRQQANAIELSSWDYRTLSQRPVSITGDSNADGAVLTVRESLGAYAYATDKQGQRMAERLMQALAARKEVHIAAGTVRTLAPGTRFTVHGHARHDASPDDDGRTFVVLRAVHLMHNNLSAKLKAEISRHLAPGALAQLLDEETSHSLHAVGSEIGERPLYRVRIDAIRSSVPYRGSRVDAHGALRFPRPSVRGQQSAIVVGPAGSVIHTDRDHRIKVQFHWQRGVRSHSRLEHPAPDGHSGAPGDDSAGTWVRVATPLAGANWGSSALPRVGQEVLVDFIDGDIDRPVVIGSLYNGRGASDAQNNAVATGNAPAWFPGTGGAHAHPATLSGFKTQAMSASQSGGGAYNQLVFDDSPGQSRLALQRHAAAHGGTDELNLGALRHQADNQRLAPAGFGAELKTEHSTALRAAQGLLLSGDARDHGAGTQLDSCEAQSQIACSTQLQTAMALAAHKHEATLKDAPAPEQLPAIAQMAHSGNVIESTGSAYSEPLLQLSAPGGITAATPASAVFYAGKTSSITAAQDLNFAAQGNSFHAVAAGISLFTYGKAGSKDKPNQEVGIKLHAASGKVSSQSQSDDTRISAANTITVASVTKSVTIGAKQHVMLTAQGAFLKLEGGNIMLHSPGKVEFKASKKELAGPKNSSAALALPKGELKGCAQASADASARQAGAQVI